MTSTPLDCQGPPLGTPIRVGGRPQGRRFPGRRRVVVLGGGLSGLLAAWAFRQIPWVEVTVLERRVRVGGERLGLPRLVRRGDALVHLLGRHQIPYSNCSFVLGVLLRGRVRAYPVTLTKMPAQECAGVRGDIWRRLHCLEPDKWDRRALIDALGDPGRVLRFDVPELVKCMAAGVTVERANVVKVEAHHAVDDMGRRFPFDHLVTTVPLWELARDRTPWRVPEAVAVQANVVMVQPKRGRFSLWDVVHTPYTPEGHVRSLTPYAGGYAVDVAGALNLQRLAGDLSFLFPDGWFVEGARTGLKGALVPLAVGDGPRWPSHVAPLGVYAEWNQLATPDHVLAGAINLARKWIGGEWWDDDADP